MRKGAPHPACRSYGAGGIMKYENHQQIILDNLISSHGFAEHMCDYLVILMFCEKYQDESQQMLHGV